MVGRKEFRNFTVEGICRSGDYVPLLWNAGKWLKELGFECKDFVGVQREGKRTLLHWMRKIRHVW